MRMDNRGVLPALLLPLIILITGASAVMLSWMFFAEMLMATLIMIFGFVMLYFAYLVLNSGQSNKVFVGLLVTAMLCMGIAVMVSPIKLTQVQPTDFNTDTKWSNKDWHGLHFKAMFMSETEFLDSYEYKSSWKSDGSGETIVAQICWEKELLSGSVLGQYQYKFFFTEGGNWGTPEKTEKKYGTFALFGYTCAEIFYKIPTGVMEGYIRVEFHAEVSDPLECPFFCWKKIVTDDAHIRSSRGWIEGFDKNPVQIGDEVKVKVSVGYATSKKTSEEGKPGGDGGWTLELYSVTPGRTVMIVPSSKIPEGQTTMVSTGYFITDADFDNNPSTCIGKNRIEVRLFNNLWQKDQLDEGVVDASSKIPNKPAITISQERPYIGEAITITVKATPSPLTNLSIIAYNVYARFEAGSGQVFHDVVNDSKYERTVSFPDSGWVVITAMCQDAGCRWSEPVEKKILVLEKDQNRFVMSIPWFFLLLILIWGAISVFLYFIEIEQLEQMHKLLIIIIGFVVIIGLFAVGIIPGVLMVRRKRKKNRRR